VEPKKRSVGASERDEFLRAAWRSLVAGEISTPSGLCSWTRWAPTHLAGTPVCLVEAGRAGVRERAAQNWGKNVTPCSSEHELGGDGTVPGSRRLDHTSEVFEAYLERVLAPSLRSGQVVVMDNLTAHKGVRGSENSWQAKVASCCSTCRPIRPTSTP
jgi:hypothetical protein